VRGKEGKPKTFDFLGFTHYCTERRNGGFKVGRKTIRKRQVNQINAVQRELRRRMHEPVGLTLKWLRSVLTGHMNYYSVPGNSQSASLFNNEIVKRWFKILRRRSQRFTLTWERFGPWVRRLLPAVRAVHPYPEMRFALNTRSRSRMRYQRTYGSVRGASGDRCSYRDRKL
jgi:RNA-directed DNA polymerase